MLIMPIYIICNKKNLNDIPTHEKILAVPFWFVIVEAYIIFSFIGWCYTLERRHNQYE
jgi:hypothetical protein